jgi:hypothetical protein
MDENSRMKDFVKLMIKTGELKPENESDITPSTYICIHQVLLPNVSVILVSVCFSSSS